MTEIAWSTILDRVPYAAYLGLQYDASARRLCLPFRDDLIGNARLPALHGGVIGGFAELAAQLWLLLQDAPAGIPKPVDFAIDYLHSARARDTYADCEVLKKGRRVAQVQVRCWQLSRDEPVAVARAHLLLDSRPK